VGKYVAAGELVGIIDFPQNALLPLLPVSDKARGVVCSNGCAVEGASAGTEFVLQF
jgi:hypothetical protein